MRPRYLQGLGRDLQVTWMASSPLGLESRRGPRRGREFLSQGVGELSGSGAVVLCVFQPVSVLMPADWAQATCLGRFPVGE